MTVNDEPWYDLRIRDKRMLSGDSVQALFLSVLEIEAYKEVIVRDVVGSAPALSDFENTPLPIENFMVTVRQAAQYDWAFFFFFKQSWPASMPLQEDTSMMRLADLTVRLVDSNFFYIYSRNPDPIRKLHEVYADSELRKSAFHAIKVPF